MPSRVENIFNRRLTPGNAEQAVQIPVGAEDVQVVIDRTQFERVKTRDNEEDIMVVTVTALGQQLGRASFVDRRFEVSDTPRPGSRLIWSTLYIPNLPKKLPSGANEITVEVEALRPFDCTCHVDFFP